MTDVLISAPASLPYWLVIKVNCIKSRKIRLKNFSENVSCFVCKASGFHNKFMVAENRIKCYVSPKLTKLMKWASEKVCSFFKVVNCRNVLTKQ
jgi:hypothetical protein